MSKITDFLDKGKDFVLGNGVISDISDSKYIAACLQKGDTKEILYKTRKEAPNEFSPMQYRRFVGTKCVGENGWALAEWNSIRLPYAQNQLDNIVQKIIRPLGAFPNSRYPDWGEYAHEWFDSHVTYGIFSIEMDALKKIDAICDNCPVSMGCSHPNYCRTDGSCQGNCPDNNMKTIVEKSPLICYAHGFDNALKKVGTDIEIAQLEPAHDYSVLLSGFICHVEYNDYYINPVEIKNL